MSAELWVRITSTVSSRASIAGKRGRIVRVKPNSMAIVVEVEGREWELFPGEWEGAAAQEAAGNGNHTDGQ